MPALAEADARHVPEQLRAEAAGARACVRAPAHPSLAFARRRPPVRRRRHALPTSSTRPCRHELRVNCKVLGEYGLVKDMPAPSASGAAKGAVAAPGGASAAAAGVADAAAPRMLTDQSGASAGKAVGGGAAGSSALVSAGAGGARGHALIPRRKTAASDWPKPEWHAPWKMMRVISGHLGWVRAIAVDPTNQWFVTGSADRTIKVWDLASGTLKLTLTGHISTVRGLAVSPRSPYLFSCGEDKMVRCWDLEYNRVIRDYHGHLSGVYSLSLHPTLDVLVTGGRDSVARVWDVRTKANVHTLCGHQQTVVGLATQALEPQVITGSMDSTIRLWDLVAGRASAVLTNHKKAVRAIATHPTEYTFASGSADNIKKWKCPEGKFLHNISGHNCIVNALAVNEDGVMVAGGDNGNMHMFDWKSG